MTTIEKVNMKYNTDKGIKHMQNSCTKLHHMGNKYLQALKHCLRRHYLSYLNGQKNPTSKQTLLFCHNPTLKP